MKYRRQKLITLAGWAALLLLSLACGIPPEHPPRPHPFPLPPIPVDDNAGSPLSNADREFSPQFAPVQSAAFDPTGQWLATAGDDRVITLWNFRTPYIVRRFQGHSAAIISLAFSPDGKTLVSGSRDKTVRLWDAATGRLLQTLNGHSGEVRSVAYPPDGKVVASGGSDHSVKLWDAETGGNLRTLQGHTATVNSVVFSVDGRTLASASDDRTIRLWDVQTGGIFQTLTSHTQPVFAVAFSPDGERFASGGGTAAPFVHHGELKFWSLSTGGEVPAPAFHFSISALAFRPDNQALALAYLGEDRLWNIEIFGLRDGLPLRHYVAHRHRITQLAYSPDGSWLVSVGADTLVSAWH